MLKVGRKKKKKERKKESRKKGRRDLQRDHPAGLNQVFSSPLHSTEVSVPFLIFYSVN
jgi:hypothetical protein